MHAYLVMGADLVYAESDDPPGNFDRISAPGVESATLEVARLPGIVYIPISNVDLALLRFYLTPVFPGIALALDA